MAIFTGIYKCVFIIFLFVSFFRIYAFHYTKIYSFYITHFAIIKISINIVSVRHFDLLMTILFYISIFLYKYTIFVQSKKFIIVLIYLIFFLFQIYRTQNQVFKIITILFEFFVQLFQISFLIQYIQLFYWSYCLRTFCILSYFIY